MLGGPRFFLEKTLGSEVPILLAGGHWMMVIGAYSDSRGLPGVRKEVAEFIQMRDGYPSHQSSDDVSGAMYSFPRIGLPPRAIEAAQQARKALDVFYCLKLLEVIGISTVPGSGFGQKEGEFHLRTTILPAEEDMTAIMDS
ncbi:hypothetical protein K1719_043905 [Acacia pycnantha]|nr:hypothetical protein K1719_043905 [Acacia pycnantha]